MDAPAQVLWSKADTTPSLPVKCREIKRSRLSQVRREGGEGGGIIQKLIISCTGFVSPLCLSRAKLHLSVAEGGGL